MIRLFGFILGFYYTIEGFYGLDLKVFLIFIEGYLVEVLLGESIFITRFI